MKKLLFSVFFVGVLFLSSMMSATDWKVQKEFYNAIKSDNPTKIKSILEKHPEFVNKKIKYHGYPVLDAVRLGSLKALKLLVEKGADIKQKEGVTGNTVLHLVNKNKLKAFLEYFVSEKKLDINIKNKTGQTPFNYTFTSNRYAPPVKVGIAAVETFDKYGADLNAQDSSGRTVLNFLAKAFPVNKKDADKTRLTSLDIAKVLIGKKGVDVNLPDKNKRTPLITFLVHTKKMKDEKRIDFVTCLMENGAKTNIRSKKKEKALKLVDRKGELYKVMKKKYKKKKK